MYKKDRHSPVVEEDLLIMISCFNKSKVIFQGCHISQKPLGTIIASKHSDRNSCLQTSSLHFTNAELNLFKRYISILQTKLINNKSNKNTLQPRQLISRLCSWNQHLGSPGKPSSSHYSPRNICQSLTFITFQRRAESV